VDTLSDLLRRTRQGDVEAFGQVITRLQDMVFGCAYAVLGDFHGAEDATQEAFINAYQKLADLRDLSCFPGWLRRLVLTACHRITRRAKLPTTTLEEAEAAPSPDGDPAAQPERAEVHAAVLDAIRSLSPANRLATTLFYINGYRIHEIADFLDVPSGTVKSRLHESRKQLKEQMLDMVKEELAEAKPTAELKERVLTEVAFGFPPGVYTSSHDAEGTITFFLSTPEAAGRPGAVGLIGLTFDRVALATVMREPFPKPAVDDAARPRRELLDLMCELLRKSGVALERVVLDVERGGAATGVAYCRRDGVSHETRVPASVALGMAHRLKAPVFATPRLVRRGAAGEGCDPKMDRKAVGELKAEVLKHRQSDALLELAWQNGLDPEAGCRTARVSVDEVAGQVSVFVGRGKRPVAVVELAKYRGGIEVLRRYTSSSPYYGRQTRDGKLYRVNLRPTGDGIRWELTPLSSPSAREKGR